MQRKVENQIKGNKALNREKRVERFFCSSRNTKTKHCFTQTFTKTFCSHEARTSTLHSTRLPAHNARVHIQTSAIIQPDKHGHFHEKRRRRGVRAAAARASAAPCGFPTERGRWWAWWSTGTFWEKSPLLLLHWGHFMTKLKGLYIRGAEPQPRLVPLSSMQV